MMSRRHRHALAGRFPAPWRQSWCPGHFGSSKSSGAGGQRPSVCEVTKPVLCLMPGNCSHFSIMSPQKGDRHLSLRYVSCAGGLALQKEGALQLPSPKMGSTAQCPTGAKPCPMVPLTLCPAWTSYLPSCPALRAFPSPHYIREQRTNREHLGAAWAAALGPHVCKHLSPISLSSRGLGSRGALGAELVPPSGL